MSRVGNQTPPAWQVERRGPLLRFARTLSRGEIVDGLDDMVNDGTILSYHRHDRELVAWSPDRDAEATRQRLQALHRNHNAGLREFGSKALQILLPPDIKKNCAPEYLKFRAWAVAGTICAGAVTFMTNAITLDALKVAFGSSANYALSTTANMAINGVASIAGSYLAQKGDADPKKCYLISSLVGVANAIGSLALFATVPHWYPWVTATTALTGALGGVLGGASAVNIFNHLARGNAKGVVQSKNSNQDLIANALLGPAFVYGLTAAAAHFGVNPYLATVLVCCPVMAASHLFAARALRLERLDRAGLERVVDRNLSTGQVEPAQPGSFWKLIKGAFVNEKRPSSQAIRFVDHLDTLVGEDRPPPNAPNVLEEYERENYLLSARDGHINLAFKKDVVLEDVIRAYMHARCVERGLGNDTLMQALRERYGDSSDSALASLVHRALPSGAATRLAGHLSDAGWNASIANLGITPISAARRQRQEPPGAANPSWNALLRLVDTHEPHEIQILLGSLGPQPMEQPPLPLKLPLADPPADARVNDQAERNEV